MNPLGNICGSHDVGRRSRVIVLCILCTRLGKRVTAGRGFRYWFWYVVSVAANEAFSLTIILCAYACCCRIGPRQGLHLVFVGTRLQPCKYCTVCFVSVNSLTQDVCDLWGSLAFSRALEYFDRSFARVLTGSVTQSSRLSIRSYKSLLQNILF